MAKIMLVHGFTQTSRSWNQVAVKLSSQGDEVVGFDLPGHGGRSGEPAGLAESAELLGRWGGHASYVGYSMGGRVCLHLALARPELVRTLVLVSTSPGIEDPEARAERRAADEALADDLERDGLDAFLERWLAQPIFAGLSEEAADLYDRRLNTVEGLAAALRLAGVGVQEPLWGRLPELDMPVLLLAGERDEGYVAVAHRAAEAIGPNASVTVIPGAGHACHLEQPIAVASTVRTFLTKNVI